MAGQTDMETVEIVGLLGTFALSSVNNLRLKDVVPWAGDLVEKIERAFKIHDRKHGVTIEHIFISTIDTLKRKDIDDVTIRFLAKLLLKFGRGFANPDGLNKINPETILQSGDEVPDACGWNEQEWLSALEYWKIKLVTVGRKPASRATDQVLQKHPRTEKHPTPSLSSWNLYPKTEAALRQAGISSPSDLTVLTIEQFREIPGLKRRQRLTIIGKMCPNGIFFADGEEATLAYFDELEKQIPTPVVQTRNTERTVELSLRKEPIAH